MAIKKITTDYSGRKRDVSINQGLNPHLSSRQPVTLAFGSVSTFCAGVQKLVQRYMISFLTALGSQSDYPEFGTEFLQELNNSNLMAQGDLIHVFNFANLRVLNLFKSYQSQHADLPLDEQISTAVLNRVVFKDDSVFFDVKIYTDAGDEVDFLVPLPVKN